MRMSQEWLSDYHKRVLEGRDQPRVNDYTRETPANEVDRKWWPVKDARRLPPE